MSSTTSPVFQLPSSSSSPTSPQTVSSSPQLPLTDSPNVPPAVSPTVSTPSFCNILQNQSPLCALLHTAIVTRNFSPISSLLQKVTGTDGSFWEAKYDEASPFISSQEDFWAVAMLHCGAEVNGKDQDGLSPLHWASSTGRMGIAQILIDFGAAVNPKALRGWTPLHFAALCCRTEIVRLLIANGASKGATDFDGDTALDLSQHAPTAEALRSPTRIPTLQELSVRAVRKHRLKGAALPTHLKVAISTPFL